MLKEIFQGTIEKEGINRNIALALFEVCPVDEFVKNNGVILFCGIEFIYEALQTKIVAGVLVHS
jgi:hypothetical protein